MDTGSAREVTGIWGSAVDNVWFAQDAALVSKWNGGALEKIVVSPNVFPGDFPQLTGSAANDIWAYSALDFYLGHFDGTGWKRVNLPNTSQGVSLWTAGSDVGWASIANGTTIARRTGGNWVAAGGFPDQASVKGVWGTAANAVYAVSVQGDVLRWDGQAWASMNAKTASMQKSLTRVWASGPGDIWAIGQQGTIIHFDGSKWDRLDPGIGTSSVSAIHGFSPSDVWFASKGHASRCLFHYDGQSLAAKPDRVCNVNVIWGAAPSDLWLGTADGRIYRRKR
jgi:hypothetical protein